MILRKNEIRIVAKKFIPVGLSFQLSPLPSYLPATARLYRVVSQKFR